jgi:hypothetical protein
MNGPEIIPEPQSKTEVRHKQYMIAGSALVVAIFILLSSGLLLPNAVFFAPFDPDASDIMDSSSRWRNSESPFAITEYSQRDSDMYMHLKVENRFPTDMMLDSIHVQGHIEDRSAEGTYFAKLTESKFNPAQQKQATVIFSKGLCSSGEVYRYLINITYHHPGLEKQVQQGQMPLVGRCQ